MRRRGGGPLSNNNWAEPENLHNATFLPFLCLPPSIHQPDQPQRFHRPPPYRRNIPLFCVRVPNRRLIYWSLFFLLKKPFFFSPLFFYEHQGVHLLRQTSRRARNAGTLFCVYWRGCYGDGSANDAFKRRRYEKKNKGVRTKMTPACPENEGHAELPPPPPLLVFASETQRA